MKELIAIQNELKENNMNNIDVFVRIHNEPIIVNDLHNDKNNTQVVFVGDYLDLFFVNEKAVIDFAEELINKVKEEK